MMTKKKTSRILGVKFVWALPAVALLLFAFAEPEYKTKPMQSINPVTDVQKGEKEFVIQGKVVQDENGKPLSGASVIIKGSTIGTVTDSEGKFTLTEPNPKKGQNNGFFADIVISYVGRESRILTISSVGETLKYDCQDIKLKEGVIQLDLKELLKELPPPPPPPKPSKTEKAPTVPSSMPTVKKEMAPPPPPPPPINSNNEDEVYTIVEELPEYPRGMGFLANDIMQLEKKLAKEKNLKGKATVGFTISETGKVTNIKIIDENNREAGKAAVEIVQNMPVWKPGSQHGKKVPVNYILPIEF